MIQSYILKIGATQLFSKVWDPGHMLRNLVVLLVLIGGINLQGQTFSIVGNGTASNTSTGYPAPFGNYYYGTRSQFFVTAAQLTAAGIPAGATISSVGFNVTATNGASSHTAFQVKVYTTSSTNPISAGYVTSSLVAQTTATSVTPVVGWNQRTLSSSFVWNGSSNLVIETCFNNTGFNVNASTQWTTSGLGTATWSRWYRADASGVCTNTTTTSTSTTTRPNIRFGWTSASPTPPGCSTMTSPSNGATGLCAGSSTVGLAWNAPTSGGAPTGYKLYVGTTNANPPNNIINGTNIGNVTSYTIPNTLAANTTYFWRIVPTNGYGDATCSTNFSFTTGSACVLATVGSNNGTSSDMQTPYTTFWHDGRHQYLLTVAELNAAGLGGGPMSSLGLNITSVATQAMSGFNIRMANVSTTSLTSSFQSASFTNVWSGTYTVPGTGWRTHNFTTPFMWNGTSNVLVEICFDNTSYTSSSQVAITNTAFASTTYAYTDGVAGCTMAGTGTSNSRPQFQIFGAALTPPGCSAMSLPANAATGVCYNGTGANLSWAAPTTGGAPTGYKVYFGTNNPPTNLVSGTNVGNVLNWNTGALSANTTYYWRIVPTNSAGDAVGCNTVWSFTTAASICAPPGCATYTAPTNGQTGVSANGTTLTWTAPTTGGVATGYKVYFGTNNPPTNLVNGTNIGNVLTWNTPTLAGTTTYYWQIVPTNGTGDATGCAVRSFTTGAVYCIPTHSSACSSGDLINTFTLSTLNNSNSGCNNSSTSYTNFPSSSFTTSLMLGSAYTMTMQAGSAYSQGFGVWIDWNQDMDFDDTGEFVYASPTYATSLFSTSITVPSFALAGQTRVRVRCNYNATVTSTQSCTALSWGETEDYTITVTLPPPPSCSTLSLPSNGSSSLCFNGTGQSLNWTAATGNLTGYKVYFGTNNPPTNIQNGTNVGNVLNWTTGVLSASTTYYWRVVPTGPGGDATSCNTIFSFTTRNIACTPPGCATYTAPANGATNQSANGISLSWSAPGSGDPPTGYKVYFGTNNPPNNLVNGTNIGNVLSWQTPALNAFTTYYWQIVPTNGTGDATGCAVWSFTSGNTYCIPVYSSSCSSGDFINLFTLNTINNSNSGCNNTTNSYTNFPTTSFTTSMMVGSTFNMTMQSGSSWSQGFGVWADWNQDMDFDDAGEFVYASPTSATTLFSTTLTVPNFALTGQTRVRVRCAYASTVASNESCSTLSYGETEDYTVTITPPPPPNCATLSTPANNATNVCYNAGQTFTWTAPTGGGILTGYKFYFGTNNPPSNLVNGTNVGNVLSYSPTLTLNPSTTYYWMVVATGPGGDATSCTVRSFTTGSTACPVPNCLTVYSTPANGTTGITSLSGIQLAWNAPTSGPVPSGYRVFLGTNNPPTNLANGQDVGNVLNVWFTNAQPNTTYYWRIVPYATGGDAVGCNTVYSFATGAGYCVPTYSSGTSSGDYIGRVSIGTLNNITTGAGSPYFTYYNNLSIPILQQGTAQVLTLSPGTYSSDNNLAAWIDYNQNGVFESGEKLGEILINAAYPTTGTISFTVQGCAIPGFTRMRVREVYLTSGIDPCASYTYGETEDYLIEISATSTVPNCATLTSPTNNTTNVSLSGTSVTWSAPVGGGCPTGYKLYFGTNNPPTNIVNGSQLGNVTTTATGTLNPSTTYYWRIVPYNNGGDASGCNTVNAFTTCDLPVAPVTSAASGIQCGQFTANWAPSTNAGGYFLDVSTSNTFSSFVPGYNNLNVGNVTSATVSGLSIGTTYYYRVRGFNACGTGTSTGSTTVTTTPVPAVPSVGIGSSPVCQGFTANWSAVTHATDYYLYVASDNGFTNIISGYNGLNVGNNTSYNVTGLSPNTTYYYRVQAGNLCGISTMSSSSTGNTAPFPAAPSVGVGSSPVCQGFTANWSSVITATHYYLYVASDNGFTNIISGYNGLNVGNNTSYNVTGLSPNTTYYYRVQAGNLCGTGNVSSSSTGNTAPLPGNITLNAGTNSQCTSFDISWISGTNTSAYLVDVATDSLFTTILTGYNGLNVGNVLSTTITGLTAGNQYFVRVRGMNTCGNGVYSNFAVGSTLPVAGVPVVGAATAVSCMNFNANWSAAQNITQYRLDVATDTGFTSLVPGYNNLNVGNVTTHQVTGLTTATQYYYRVKGENTCTTSNPSGSVSQVTINLQDSVVVTSNTPVCENGSLNLSANGFTGISYLWTGPAGYTSALASPTIANVQTISSGVYSLIASYTGCNDAPYTHAVVVSQPITVVNKGGNTPLCSGENLNLTSSGGHYNTQYSWTGPNGFTASTANAQVVSIPVQGAGVYTITLTSPGCNAMSDTLNVVIIPSQPVSVTTNSPICQGDALYFTVTTVLGSPYTWSGPNGFSTTVQNPSISQATPLNSGVYTVIMQQPGCNAQTYFTTVNVSPQSNTFTLSSNSPVCTGNTLSLTASAVTGATYLWTGPNGFSSNSRIISIPNAATNHSGQYSVMITNPGCSNQVRSLNVLVNPPLVVSASSNTPVCQGGALNFSASNHNMATYQWSGPNGWVSTLNNPAITNVGTNRSGVYTFVVTQPGCGTASQTVSVIVGASITNATVTSNTPVCTGNNLQISAPVISGVTYAWAGPNGFTSSLAQPVIAGAGTLNSGMYTVTLSSPGCNNNTLMHSATVYPSLVLTAGSNSPVCQGSLLNFTATQIQDATYQWNGPAGFQSTSRVPAITNAQVANSGVYTLISTQPSCGTQSTTVSVVVGPAVNNAQIGSNQPLCTTGMLNLTATQFAGASYSWTGPNGFTSNLSLPAPVGPVTTLDAGTYSLTISSPGCSSNSLETGVTVHPPLNVVASANTPLCQGAALYLSASFHAGATYSWAGPNGFASTGRFPSISVVNSTHSGVYTVTVVQPGCGIQVQTVSVTVGINPTTVVAGTNSPICSGNTLFLSATNISGVTYGWSGPNGYTSSAHSPSIPNATSGEAGIYSFIASSPGCQPVVQTFPVIVNTPAVLSAGLVNNPVCEGSALLLTSNTISGGVYQWTGPGGFSARTENPSISNATPAHSGIYSLSVTQPGCGAYTTSVSASVGAQLSGINGGSNSPVCVGGNLNLTSVNRSGVTYLWTGPGGFTSSLSNVTFNNITLAVAGNYMLTASSPGCGSASYTAKVVVNNPTGMTASSNSPVCGGSVLQLMATGASRSTYSWTGPNSFASTLQSPSISNAQVVSTGVYTVIINDPTCGPVQLTTTVQVGANLNTTSVSSNSPVCISGTLNLSATSLSGATYAWAGPNGFTSAVNNPSVAGITALDAGNYSVTISTPGCNPLMRTTSVLVSPALLATPGSNSPICQGSVLYLTSNTVSGATYFWEGPGGFTVSGANPSLINAQPVNTGIYTLTINSPSCGVITSTTVVAVGGTVSNVAVSSNSPVCVGNQLNLSSTLVSSGTITWTGPDGFTSNQQNVNRAGVLSNAGGVYTYTASSPGCGSITRTLTVVVNPAPVLNAGSNSPVCQGNALLLSVNTVSGATYSWSGPNGYVSTLQSPSISNAQPIRTGIYTVSVTNSSCGTTTTTTSVTVNSSLGSLALTSNSPVCTGNNLNLSITNRTGFTFSWSGPNGFASTTATPVIAGATSLDAGRYTVVVSSAGCGSTTVQSGVLVVNNPASVTATSTSPVCVGGVIFFTGAAPLGSTYSWSGPSAFASTVQNPSRTNAQLSHAGVYTMNATVPGCGVVSTTTAVTVNTCRQNQDQNPLSTGVEESGSSSGSTVTNGESGGTVSVMEYGKLTAWPNPNSGDVVMLKWEGLSDHDGTITVRVLDALGKEVLVKSVDYDLSGRAGTELVFPVRLSGGVYTIETVHDNRYVYSKLVVE